MSGILAALAGIKTAIATAVDEYFNRTTLLLNTSSTNGAQNNTFLDSSTNNFTITRNGNTTQGTFTPFSHTGWGNYFGGSSDWLSISDSAAFTLGTGDFTVEYWVYWTNSGVVRTYGQVDSSGLPTSISIVGGTDSSNKVINRAFSSSTDYLCTSTASLSTNTWTHIAFVRDGTTLRQYISGVQDGTVSISTASINDSTNQFSIGRAGEAAANYFGGYISNFRLIKGTCLYPSGTTFTPSTTPLTAISGTSLLTCQSNRFLDNSSNAFAITANGSPSVQAFSPFAPTAAYDTAVVGGSGYFDGTGDYLATPSSANLAMGSGDFTIECWVNTPLTGARYIFDIRPSGSQAIGAYISSSNLYVNSGSTLDILASSAFVLNAWNHFAYVRSGSGSNNVSIFLNGVRVYQRTDATDYSSNAIVYVGADNAGAYSNGGYISGFRILKGTAQYSGATITLPTAPVTAVANTQLLLNYTNTGIFDSTAKNVLETVGNAQVSTTQAKWGTTSMYFDGTGDYLKPYYPAPANGTTFSFGTGDFTVEFWMYPTSAPSNGMIMDGRGSGASGDMWLINWVSGAISWYVGGSLITSSTVSTNTWTHVAICRSGTSTKMFLNGTQTGSTYTDTKNYTVGNGWVTIGASFDAAEFFTGYLDDLRITKYARYTTNFTAPAAAFALQ